MKVLIWRGRFFSWDHKKIDHARRKRCRKGSCKEQVAYCSDLIYCTYKRESDLAV